jgi:polar amino acid transport system substrate-binding protein
MKPPYRTRLLLILFCWLTTTATLHAEPLRLNSGVSEPYFKENKQGFIDLLVPTLFQRIGVEAVGVQYAASERAMLNANSGIDDGVVLRIKGLERAYPNLVRIDEKILDNDFVAYAKYLKLSPKSFADLKPFQVAHINGWKIFENGLPADTAVTKVQTPEQLFSLLANDRADIVLYERWQGNHLIAEQGIKAQLLWPPLASMEMFMYLHKKHEHLVEPAARALRAMKADGSYQRIATQTLPGYGKK